MRLASKLAINEKFKFLFNFGETLPKVPINELVNWWKFGQDWTKIVEFLLIANFDASLISYKSVSKSQSWSFPQHLLAPLCYHALIIAKNALLFLSPLLDVAKNFACWRDLCLALTLFGPEMLDYHLLSQVAIFNRYFPSSLLFLLCLRLFF